MLGELWWAVTVLILARELGITLLRFVVIRHGVMPAGRGGKAKTVVQSAAILLYIAPLPDPVQPLAQVMMVLAVFLTVATAWTTCCRPTACGRAASGPGTSARPG